jgi:phosphotransferase family enzyme
MVRPTAPPPPRSARIVLVDPAGDPLGALRPVPVETPWWPDIAPVVRAVHERFGLDVVVLRMLSAARPAPPGGEVTYLAETASSRPRVAEHWNGRLDDHPLRMSWARPGGPAADLRWANAILDRHGITRVGSAEQIRTWNLSSLWRIPTAGGAVWLKHVPPFFAHEGALLAELQGSGVPALLGHDGGRILMPEIPGEDQYDADDALLERMISLLMGLQRRWVGRVDDLLALGLPDWRGPALAAAIADVLAGTADELEPDDRQTLDPFVAGLGERFDRLASCRLPDTLVHGDFHAGNARGDRSKLVLLDWGDSGVGHPLLDQPAFFEPVAPPRVPALREGWARGWETAVPGSEPDRAGVLLAPIAAARQAVIYRNFLDNIEPSEWPYHRSDPALWLRETAAIVRGEG